MNTREQRLIAMAEVTRDKVAKIDDAVDPHKRYDSHDSSDSYGEVIAWLHETGRKILSE